MTDLPTLRASARTAEEAFETALVAHFGRAAPAYARYLPPAALPAPIAALALARRHADDRLIAALRASARAVH